MTSFDPPEMPADAPATTGIQRPSETPSIPLAPLPRPPAMSVEQFAHRRGWLDALLVALVLAFAFLIASFPAANPDFFRQAAVGRLIVQGAYAFGVDPFSFAADDVYQVNHSWLFGLLVYALYQIPAVGGTVLVIGKALLAAALAEIMLRTGRRRGQSLWIPAACTVLAILAVSPRLLLQSTCLSFLFLGLTLWLLQRPPRSWWWLPPLFALWANCDAWFVLGPLTVALYLVGELIQRWLPSNDEGEEETRRSRLQTLGLVLLVGLAACLINPHHVHVFTLPPELGLSPAADLLHDDAQFRFLYLSPLHAEYYEPYLGRSVAGLSYLPLLLVGLLSFVFLRGRAPAWRLLIWLGFALLSLYNVRCIPFFALVAGPITALNWLDFAARRRGDAPRLTTGWLWWSLGGRVLTILLLLVLLAATVPGWLQAQPYDHRRVGWRVVADPSLEQTARQIHEWRKDGKLPPEPHWFNMRREVADYVAWFAPGERVFLDQQLPYARKAAEDYLAVRKSLEQMIRDGNASKDISPAEAKKKWEKILRDRRVHYWILDTHRASLRDKADMVAQIVLFTSSTEWPLCSVQGRSAIFAWRDPQAKDEPDPSDGLELDLKRLAFGREAEQAPPQGPEIVVPSREPWDLWLHAPPPVSANRQAADLYIFRFDAFEIHENLRAWRSAVAAGAVAAVLPRGPMPNSLLALSWSGTYHDQFPPGQFQPARRIEPNERVAMAAWSLYTNGPQAEPPPSLYLALRAARRALADNPQDPQTHLLLGQIYARFDGQPHEQNLKTALPLAEEIRRTQMTAAFHNCLRFPSTPDVAAAAHQALFGLFDRLHYQDVAAAHFREWMNNLRAAGPKPNVSATQHAQMLDKMDRELKRREKEVEQARNLYVLNAKGKSALEKFSLAREKGLADLAAQTAEEAASEMNDPKGQRDVAREVVLLLLNLGRLDKARAVRIFDPEETAGQPVPPNYLDLHLRLAAASGDYEQADRLLADALNYAWKNPAGQSVHFRERMLVSEAIGCVLLSEAQRFAAPRSTERIRPLAGSPQLPLPLPRYAEAMLGSLAIGQQRTDWQLLRSWLAVESGRCVEARDYFQDALKTVTPSANWAPQVNRLNVLLPAEANFLQELALRQDIAQNVSRQYLKWLETSQR
jgi:hypothetical protein